MNKTQFRLMAAVLAISVGAPAANAATMINGPGMVTLDADDPFTPLNPFTFKVLFGGVADGFSTGLPGLSAEILFNFLGTTPDKKTFNFSYTLTNTSGFPLTESRASIFGFNVDPNVSGATSAGLFPDAIFTPGPFNTPNGGPNVELCFKDANGPNCTGGGGSGGPDPAGVTMAEHSGSGTFSLLFSGVPTQGEARLTNFYIRYQSIYSPTLGLNDASASGGGMVVPEPATWAMMIAGFGLVGGALRRRRLPRPLAA